MNPAFAAAATVEDRCRHDALLFASDAELVAANAPFIADGITAGDMVVVEGTRRHVDLLREAFDDDPRVHFTTDEYPRRVIMARLARYQRLCAAENASGRRVRCTSDRLVAPDPQSSREWERYEALISRAFGPFDFFGLCRYDVRTTPERVLDHALAVHDRVYSATGVRLNDRRRDPDTLLSELSSAPLDPLLAWPPVVDERDCRSPAWARHEVERALRRDGIDDERVDEFVAAVNEVISNALQHGMPPVQLRLHTDGHSWLCAISDQGPGIADRWTGVDAPRRAGAHMGLWVARQLCDGLDIGPGAPGTTVVLRLDGSEPDGMPPFR